MKERLGARWLLGVALGVFLLPILAGVWPFPWTEDGYRKLMHVSGEVAARLLVLTLLISPLRLLWPRAGWLQWLAARRRFFGVASFGYAAVHLAIYLAHRASLAGVFADLTSAVTILGWWSFLVLLPLAATSHERWIRWLGARRWKRLQRLAYVAAVATAGHWLLAPGGAGVGPVLVHFLPLTLLELYRIRLHFRATSAAGDRHLVV